MMGEVKELAYECNVPGKVVKEQQESGVADMLHQATGPGLRTVVDQLLVAHRKLEAVKQAKAEVAAAALKAKQAKQERDKVLADAGMARPGKKKADEEVEEVVLKHRYQLVVDKPTINPSEFGYQERGDLVDSLEELLSTAEKHTPKAGDEYTLALTITVKMVSVKEDEEERNETVVQDAERQLLQEQLA
jgi:hypothetical protein